MLLAATAAAGWRVAELLAPASVAAHLAQR
jgi:hypothetical protein